MADPRTIQHGVSPMFTARWSPRAMSGEPLTEKEILRVFEAAKWAPSAYNAQPWKFVYARRGTPSWEKLLGLLVPFNQAWCSKGSVLCVIISRNLFEHNGTPNPTHSFDAGAAWMSLALEASAMGIVAHGMSGFDFEAAKKTLGLSSEWTVNAMCCLGKPAPKETLPKDFQDKEAQSGRKDIAAIAVPLEKL